MRKKLLNTILGTVLAVSMLSGQCFAAGSQTKVVETLSNVSIAKVNGEEVAVEIVAANTDMESANDFTVVTVPETLKPAINTVITSTKETGVSYTDVIANVQSTGASVKIVLKTVDPTTGQVVVTENPDIDLSKTVALTAPFELFGTAKDSDDIFDQLEEAQTVLKVLELEALSEKNADNADLLETIYIACWVPNEDGELELQLIKPEKIDLATGEITVNFGDLKPSMAQIIYEEDLVVPAE